MFKDENRHYSLRKLSIGLASVLIGISFASSMNGSSVKADTVQSGSNSVQTVVKGSDAVVKTDAESAPEGQSQTPEAVKKDSGAITQDIKQDAVNTKAKQQNTAVQGSDAAGDMALKANNSSVVQEDSSAKNDSLAGRNNALKAKAEAAKKAVAVVLRADSSETALNLKGTNAIDPETLKEDKTETIVTADPARGIDPVKFASNGGFDPKIWGTMDTSKWQLDDNGNITGYTGDMSHIIIPNASDFAKDGKSYSQIGISSYEMKQLGGNANSKADTLAISLTDNKKVKATNAYWSDAFDGSTLKQANLEGLDTNNVTDMDHMFNLASSLTSLDVSKWDTSNVTDMNDMFYGASSLNSLDVSKWDTSNVTDMNDMFYSASSLNSLDVSKWDTSKVTDMSYMFYGASGLTSLDVSKWNTGNVTNMSGMFRKASSLNSLDVSKWDTSKVTNMSWMFNLASSLTSLDVSNWDTGNVTDMNNMFSNATDLTNIGNLDNWNTSKVTDMSWMFGTDTGKQSHLINIGDLSKWQTGKVTDMHEMFANATNLTNIGDLSKWQTGNVTDMSWMFGGTTNLTNIGNLDNWNTSNVTDMHNMFANATNLTNIGNLDNWNTSNVTDMHNMFANATNLTNIGNLDNWNTSNVTDMSWMFGTDTGKQSHLTNIGDLSKWDTGNVTDMSCMFFNATNLTNIGNLDNWSTSKVTNMIGMFGIDSGKPMHLTNIGNLSKWQTGNVTNMSYMFSNATNLTNIGNLDNWNTSKVTDMSYMFYNATHLTNIGNLSKWQTSKVTNMLGMFGNTNALRHLNISDWNLTKLANKDAMKNMFANVTNLTVIANNLKLPTWYENEINDADYFWNHHIAVITNVPELIKSTGDIDNLKIDDQDASRSIFYDSKGSSDAIKVLTDANNQYIADYNKANPTKVLKLADTVDQNDPIALANASFVTVTYKLVESNTNDAFALDSKHGLHEHANVNDNGGYDTDFWGKINVDDWNYTVNGDRIEINGLKDSALTGANDAVIVPNLDDFKLVGKDGGAKTVYISMNALGINAKHKYYGLSKTNGNIFATDSDLSLVFYKNSNLTHADLNSLNTSNTTNMNYMFSNTKSLTDLDVSNWDTGKATTMTAMFIGASSLTNLDVSKWNTSNVTNMGRMFTNASSLTNLDVSHWDTSKVTDMHAMFYNASSLTNLDVSHWDTSKVTNMRYMFDGAHSLTNLNVSDWDTSKVTNMRDMFNGAGSLALIVNGDKFADYLVKNNFADSRINSGVKSVTTDNTKLLQLLTNDSQHDSSTRTIVLTFPAVYSPDLTKYHLTKTGNTYQIKQSVDYDKPYLQGTVLINATGDITEHHIDTTKPNKLSDTWQPNYDKLVLAHKNSDGSVSFDAIQLPKVPGYKARINNPNMMLFSVSFMALPKPVTPVQNDAKPAKTVTPAIPVAIDVAKPIKTEPKVATTLKVIDLSDDAVSTTPKEATWQVANNLEHDTYHVSNGKYTVELPHISNAQLHVIANDSTKDSVLFTYKGQNTKYVFNIKFANGHYLLSTYEIKSGKLVKLIDYNFIKSSKMIDTILDWIKR